MAFKIALNAGHYLKTAGKHCAKSLDPNGTKEWVLNDRICDKIEKKLQAYEGYQLLRVDDTTGSTDVSVANRATKANSWGADFYLSIHHNAGIYGGAGGGVMAFIHPKAGANTKDWQTKLYNAIIAKTGLKGNRATPITTANFEECRKTKMACVLLECGFMDSKTDVPIILTDAFAEQVADACVEVLVAKGGLKKKVVAPAPTPVDNSGKIYRVQVGAYKNKANAVAMQEKLKAAGFSAIIV